ncbi:hypothetical protein GWN19_01615 [Candidatus Bathyarchaeota archaeon]|nr:hypothetical protein [Candidatus Bathyarchaeota archaeon]
MAAVGECSLDLYNTTLVSSDQLSIDHQSTDGYGYFTAPPDVVSNVTPSKTVVGQGYSMFINVTVENQGPYTETFNVTVYANTTIIETKTNITLTSGSSTALTIPWNTTGIAEGNYTITAHITPLPETDTTDNSLTGGTVVVTIPGDVNGDHKVDLKDVFAVALAYGSYPGHPMWNPNLDINGDQKVDLKDYFAAVLNYGESW